MITIKQAEDILKKEYHVDNFLYMVKELILPDYQFDRHEVLSGNTIFESVKQLGYSDECDVTVFEVILKDEVQNRRVAITQEMFRLLKSQGISNALVAFANKNKLNYRLSLLTSKYEFDGDKIVKVLSNPRRYSYSLGFGTKTKTAYDFLISKGKVHSLDELIDRFSVEIVNKQFYNDIAIAFTKLIGGKRENKNYEKELKIHGVVNSNKYAEFAVRLIGRIVFCWFLKEKKSPSGLPLIPDNVLSTKAIVNSNGYYHDVLEPLFFELLNTSQSRRKDKYSIEAKYKQIPYLNGGLFSPHVDDHYKYCKELQCGQYGLVDIPNSWFSDFFAILEQYNFTVDENTSYDIELSIDPEMLGRIFENLLAEINPETGENAKKSTGSFYTPRDIVDYMVDNSILEYLKSKTAIDEQRLKALISYSKEDDNIAVFDLQEKKHLINALYKITVLDPACGSGAFPIGMLQKIVYILQEIDEEANLWFDKATESVSVLLRKEFEKKFNSGSLDYIRKLSVIQNSIFGVDIQPIAVEIARLRCFLSLVIEEKVLDNEPNRGINPLPSLDFKFIIANSLIDLDNELQMSLFENQDHIDELRAVRDEYFNADNERKTELKLEFANIQQNMLMNNIANYSKQSTKRYWQLSSWKPFNNEPTDWFDPEWMFGINNGFDIVIGNPPYIQLQKSIDESKTKLGDLYQKCGYSTFAKTGDIYCLFYERGCNLLKPNGILTYITSNKWMRAGYGESLRKFLAQYNPLQLIDFAGQKVFETATVDVNILLLKKAKNEGNTLACTAKEECRNNLSDYIQHNSFSSEFLTSAGWSILSPVEQSIKRKIETLGTPLKDWNITINYGVKTGFNDAFIIDGAKRSELITQDPKSAEIIRPILRGRDIKRYSYSFADLYLICTFPSRHYDINDYPAIKNHLLSFGKERLEQTGLSYEINGEKVTARKKTQNKWFETQDSISYWDDFSHQKIMYNDINQRLSFSLVEKDIFCNNTVYFISSNTHTKYLLACLNSKIIDWYYKTLSVQLGEKAVRMFSIYVEKIPVPPVDSELESNINEIIDRIIENPLPLFINELDNYFYKIYQLSAEEQNYIEKHYKLSM